MRQRVWAAFLLVAGAIGGLSWLGWRGSVGAQRQRCEALAGWRPVEVAVASADRPAAGIGYRSAEGELLLPLRGLVEPFVKGPLGIYWDEATATLSLLGPEDVLSIHFPDGETVRERAILNGEAVALRAVACGGQFYLSGSHLGDLLRFDMVAVGEGEVRLTPR